MTRVFLDATCWIAAAGSETGGSSAIISLAQAFLLALVVSQAVLQEAERNIRAKMGAQALQRFHSLLAMTELEVCEATSAEAAAYKAKADVLVTLDRKHVLTDAVQAEFPIIAQDTKEFLTAFRG